MSNKDQVASQLTKYVDLTGALYALITGSLIGFGELYIRNIREAFL
jgi:hypothetical protein